ncbi:MAG TPA: ThuA domain-containing protein [Verrucomicrobiae bacterium]|nr:ThuA domain-containing protein [Verrucomicrobiae bacterium]
MKAILILLALELIFARPVQAESVSGPKKVLFFSKAASWEKRIIHRTGNELSLIERAAQKLGQENNIEFTFSKDGTIFTPENIAVFDAFFFFTSGDLTSQHRNGRGDNFPLMTLDGKKAFLDAIQNGKGFIGCNTAVYTFIERLSPGEKDTGTNASRYTRMIGAGYIGHNEVQPGYFTYMDHSFPGMESVPSDYRPLDQWYSFREFMPDLHVIMALDSPKLVGNLYGRQSYPIIWARMEGKGRVFYTTMGHTAEMWRDPVFLQMLLGGIKWATGTVDADVTPNMMTITPHANEIPDGAKRFIASNPPKVHSQFPNFKVWLPESETRSR